MRGPAPRARKVDFGLSALLLVQGFTLFVGIPLGSGRVVGPILLDGCHLLFTAICIAVLTNHAGLRAILLASVAGVVAGPLVMTHLSFGPDLSPIMQHDLIAIVAFFFNACVTALVARHVFAPARVTVHRVRGAILLYLNVAALFAIAYGLVGMNVPGAFASSAMGHAEIATGQYTYFSLVTITTTGYGDLVPVHPLARSLANLEAVFGQLFPATLLTRLVSLNIFDQRRDD